MERFVLRGVEVGRVLQACSSGHHGEIAEAIRGLHWLYAVSAVCVTICPYLRWDISSIYSCHQVTMLPSMYTPGVVKNGALQGSNLY